MSNPSELVDQALLRRWGLPDPGDSKKSRGQIIAVGGSRRAPGAVLLAGEAALRVGAGRLALLVSASIQDQLGIVMPEAAVFSLPDQPDQPLQGSVRDHVEGADAVLIGPGFDDPEETADTVRTVSAVVSGCLVLDAFALGILDRLESSELPDRLVLTPNTEEAAILLGRKLSKDSVADLAEIAARYGAVVSCYSDVVAPDGRAWHIDAGGPGLGTSGSGDVLAGAITGFAARGLDPAQAAVWGSWAHATAGDVLSERVGIGFLARELLPELTRAVHRVA